MSAAQEAHLAGPPASYRGLFAEPWAGWLALADVCAPLPQGMITVTLLLVAAQHASMRVAGLVVAGYTLAQGRVRAAAGTAGRPARAAWATIAAFAADRPILALGLAFAMAAAATLSAAHGPLRRG